MKAYMHTVNLELRASTCFLSFPLPLPSLSSCPLSSRLHHRSLFVNSWSCITLFALAFPFPCTVLFVPFILTFPSQSLSHSRSFGFLALHSLFSISHFIPICIFLLILYDSVISFSFAFAFSFLLFSFFPLLFYLLFFPLPLSLSLGRPPVPWQ